MDDADFENLKLCFMSHGIIRNENELVNNTSSLVVVNTIIKDLNLMSQYIFKLLPKEISSKQKTLMENTVQRIKLLLSEEQKNLPTEWIRAKSKKFKQEYWYLHIPNGKPLFWANKVQQIYSPATGKWYLYDPERNQSYEMNTPATTITEKNR